MEIVIKFNKAKHDNDIVVGHYTLSDLPRVYAVSNKQLVYALNCRDLEVKEAIALCSRAAQVDVNAVIYSDGDNDPNLKALNAAFGQTSPEGKSVKALAEKYFSPDQAGAIIHQHMETPFFLSFREYVRKH